MTRKNTLKKLAALLKILAMLFGSFPVRYYVTNAIAEGETEVTAEQIAAEDEAARLAAEEAARRAEEGQMDSGPKRSILL